jgi:GNAT superfamily N-acetyltransferase
MQPSNRAEFKIRPAIVSDCSTILQFIRLLADEKKLAATLFGDSPSAEVIIAEYQGKPVGLALFFTNYSTFLAQPGIYLEDLVVETSMRGKGFGKALLTHLAKIAVSRHCGRLEWSVLDWNQPAIDFYHSLGAVPMEGWTVNRLTGEALHNVAKQAN